MQDGGEANVGEKGNLAFLEKPRSCRGWVALVLGAVHVLASAACQSRARGILLVTHCSLSCVPSPAAASAKHLLLQGEKQLGSRGLIQTMIKAVY